MSDPNVIEQPEALPVVACSDLLGVGIERADGSVVCALCEYEAEWSECNDCGGDGGHDPCAQCNSRGGDWWCENPKCETQNIWKLRKAKPTPNGLHERPGANA